MSTRNRLHGSNRRRTDIIVFDVIIAINYTTLWIVLCSPLMTIIAIGDNRTHLLCLVCGLHHRYPAWNMTPFAYCLQSRTWLAGYHTSCLLISSDHAILHIIIQQIKRPRLTRSSKERETRHLTHFPSFNDVALIIRFRSPTSVSINNTLHSVLDIILVRLAKCGMGKEEWSAQH